MEVKLDEAEQNLGGEGHRYGGYSRGSHQSVSRLRMDTIHSDFHSRLSPCRMERTVKTLALHISLTIFQAE